MSIQAKIDAAPPGGTVAVAPGTYNEQLIIDKPLTLTGPASGEAIIDAGGMAAVPVIHILANDVTVQRLTIRNGPLQGIRVGDAANPNLTGIVIKSNIIRGHGRAGIDTINNASLLIEDNLIENNGLTTGTGRAGIFLFPHGNTIIRDNIIRNNIFDGIFARASSAGLTISANVISGHSLSGITLAWDEQNVSITNNHIEDNGTGTFEEQGGIVIIQSVAEEISDNTIIDNRLSGIFWGWVATSGPAPEILITGNVIQESSRDGIYLFSQGPGGFLPPDPYPLTPEITNNQVLDNGRAGVYISNLFFFSPGNANPEIHNNDLVDNTWGVFNATSGIVDATLNWWGANSGPFHSELNPQGTGDPVSDRVLFEPWLVRPPTAVLDCQLTAISLVDYQFAAETSGKTRVTTTIELQGMLTLEYDTEVETQPFEHQFTKTFLLPGIPDTGQRELHLLSRGECVAELEDGTVLVTALLHLLFSVQTPVQLLVPSYGFCPVPAVCGENNPAVQQAKLRAEAVYTDLILARCRQADCVEFAVEPA
ncbi:MAG: hypothetical protein FH749_02280 [Firmicutes bacterium]|nr:hypothetical protein [Bacillota bacterium]